jgi:hypothetical protein
LATYDADGSYVKPYNLETALMGSLVLVYFQVKHYAIRNSKSAGLSSNTFSAMPTQVKILECAAESGPSPYKAIMLKGPTVLPQKKRDQIAAVNAFHPGNFTRMSPSPHRPF